MLPLTRHIADAGHRWLRLGPLAAIVTAAAVVALAGSAGRTDAAVRSAPANARAAQRDAASLLAKLTLPPGAVRETSEPAGDDGTLAEPGSGPPLTPNAVDDHAWWSVPGTPQQVVQYIQEHPPAGGALGLSGTSSATGKPTVLDIGFGWPAIAGELSLRSLVVAAVQLPD